MTPQNQADLVPLSSRLAGVIQLCYDVIDTPDAYLLIDPSDLGYKLRDVILADELGFTGVPVGVLVEDLVTEEIVEAYRGTRVVVAGPNEWFIDAQVWLDPCPFVPGAKTERGFTSTEETFRLLSGKPFPTTNLITGHSLAAAWALLRATKFKTNMISFAGPRVGNRAFSDAATQAIPLLVRWVNDPDAVPKSPIPLWPLFEYIHAGPADELNSEGKVIFDPRAWHSLGVYRALIDPSQPIPPEFAAPQPSP